MALTDNVNTKKDKRNKDRSKLAESNFRYSDNQKLEAVTTYLATGNLALTSRLLTIPEITLRVWKASEWWQTTVDEIKLSENLQLSNRMKKLVEASQNIVAQRLEMGDPYITQKGEVAFKPVALRDAHRVAVDLIDRQKVLDKLTTDNSPSEAKDDDKLERLAEKFAEMATKSIEKQINKRRTVDVVVEEIDAVSDEREEGLQARISEGEESPPGETGSESGQEQSSSNHDESWTR